ncbi:hypothetical protein Tco_1039389, partial [Tanacetum coccineum]
MDRISTPTQFWNGSDEYAYSVLEWIGLVRLPNIGMDRMGEHSEAKEFADEEYLTGALDSLVDHRTYGVSMPPSLEDAPC